jgi:hypothetical protein
MDGVELQPLASMHSHQSNRINVQRGRRDLTHIPLFGEEDKLSNSVEHSPNRKTGR